MLAEDPATHRVDAEPIQAVIDDGIKPLMQLHLSDGSSLAVTTNHPFYVDTSPVRAQEGWVQAGDLRVGDRLRTEDGRDVTVTTLRYHTGYAHVYTLTVAHDHTFFVGAAGVLVHNAGGLKGPCGERGGVYTLTDPNTSQVLRTGRASSHVKRRSDHKIGSDNPATRGLEYSAVYFTDDRLTQQGLEGYLSYKYPDAPLNGENSISEKRAKASAKLAKLIAALQFLKITDPAGYGELRLILEDQGYDPSALP